MREMSVDWDCPAVCKFLKKKLDGWEEMVTNGNILQAFIPWMLVMAAHESMLRVEKLTVASVVIQVLHKRMERNESKFL